MGMCITAMTMIITNIIRAEIAQHISSARISYE